MIANPAILTARDIRARLARTSMPSDPLGVVLPPALREWPKHLREQLNTELKPAAVLVPLLERADDLSVLLTRRSSALRYHASQVSFPGGCVEDHDADILATALRETHEEVGIEPGQVEIAGYLDPTPTITGYAITAVVGFVHPAAEITIDPGEVAHTFEVPLSFLLNPANERRSEREYNGVMVPIVEFRFASERIWGATANILLALRRSLDEESKDQ